MHQLIKASSSWKRILLIKPNYRVADFPPLNLPPLNLTYIASYLIDLDVDVEILDAKVKNLNTKQLRKKIQKFQPDIVGITVFVTPAIKVCYKIAKIVKEINQNCIVVFGGRHPTFEPDDTFKSKEVDIIVRGEGELTFRELIVKGSPENVKGISHRYNGKILHNPDRPLMDYTNIRFPARHLLKNNKYSNFTVRQETIESSRGCPYSCKFCTTHIINNGHWRPQPIEKIIMELKMISKNKHNMDIFFVDDNFTADTKRIERLCNRIIECKKNKEMKDFKFLAQIRADSVVKSPQMIKKMAKAGFYNVFFGIESIYDKTLQGMGKGFIFSKVLKALEILHKNNIIVMGNMIIGSDLNQKEEDVIKEIKFMKNVDVDILTFSLLTPFPGSETFRELEEKNLVITKDWTKYTLFNPVIKTYQLSSEKLRELLLYAFKEFKYSNNLGAIIHRLIKTRGKLFFLNPIRLISLLKLFIKTRILFKILSKQFINP